MNKLKFLRQELKLSIRELSNLISIPPTTITQYENENRDINTNTLKLFAEYFEVTIDYLLCFSKDGIIVNYENSQNQFLISEDDYNKYQKENLIYYKDNKRYLDINKKLNIPKNKNISSLFDVVSQQDILEDFINDKSINIKVPLDRIGLVEKIIRLDENKLNAVKSMFELL